VRVPISYRAALRGVEGGRRGAAESISQRWLMAPEPRLAPRMAPSRPRVGGLELADGDIVWLGIGSANRDPRKFPEPGRFTLGRDSVNQHLGIDAGPHRRLGMHLARAELAIVLREWHERIPDYWIRRTPPSSSAARSSPSGRFRCAGIPDRGGIPAS
jgi:cytochrome P450